MASQLGNLISNLTLSINKHFVKFLIFLSADEYSKEAIELLSNSGIKFDKHKSRGINPQVFAEYLISSGLFFYEI